MAIQLKAVGTIQDERGVERLCHWAENSSMPDAYNNEACVAELHTRAVVANAVNVGWRQATFGNVPTVPRFQIAPVDSKSSPVCAVRRRLR